MSITLNDITMVDKYTYKLKSMGNEITLIKNNNGWDVYVVNASVRAHRRGFAASKHFESLEAVEKSYKSLAGIGSLINELDVSNPLTH